MNDIPGTSGGTVGEWHPHLPTDYRNLRINTPLQIASLNLTSVSFHKKLCVSTLFDFIFHMLAKPTEASLRHFCIADQHKWCFTGIIKILLLLKSKCQGSSHWCGTCTASFVSEQFGNHIFAGFSPRQKQKRSFIFAIQISRTATTSKVVKVFTKRHQARQKIIPSKWRHENGAKYSLIYGLYFASNLKCQFCLDICLLFSILFTSIFNIFNFNRSRNAI